MELRKIIYLCERCGSLFNNFYGGQCPECGGKLNRYGLQDPQRLTKRATETDTCPLCKSHDTIKVGEAAKCISCDSEWQV